MTLKHSQQIKEKLVKWDADWYKSLSPDDCIVCLTEQQVYLVGQIITQLTWERTRWIGDKSGLDFKAISGNLEDRLADKMTCKQLTDIIAQIENITNILNQLTGNETIFDPNTTVINDITPQDELTAIGYDSGTCTTSDKDALYGGISQLVRYMHQKNVDFFEELNQIGNLTGQIDRLKDTTGVLNVIPFANAFDWATFYIEELLQEYEATVDEALLQDTICDLFCIAVNSGCTLNLYDVFDYFAAKVEPSFSNFATTSLDLIEFALSGTMSGDEYYYYATFFQLAMAGMSQLYLGTASIDVYATQFLAGLNSPDNDWSIFCISCPTQYRLWEWDFSRGLGALADDGHQFTVVQGALSNGRIESLDETLSNDIELLLTFTSTWRVKACKLFVERINGLANGSQDHNVARFRITEGSDVGATASMPQGGFQPNGVLEPCGQYSSAPGYATNNVQVWIAVGVSDNSGTGKVYLDKIQMLFEMAYAPADTRVTEDGLLCS